MPLRGSKSIGRPGRRQRREGVGTLSLDAPRPPVRGPSLPSGGRAERLTIILRMSHWPCSLVTSAPALSSSFGVADAVLRREAEFGINVTGSHDAELVSVPLVRDRFVVVCRDDHALATRKRVSWHQLEAHPLIFAGHSSANRQVLDLALADGSLELRVHHEVQHSSTALGLVAQGVSAAVVPNLAVQKDAYPRIRIIPLIEPMVSRSLVLISPRHAHLSPAAQALCDMVVRHAHA